MLCGAVAFAATAQTIGQLRDAARRSASDARVQYNLGLALVQKGLLAEAINPLRKATQDPALAGEAHFLLGADYFEARQYANAIAELKGLANSNHAERVLFMLEESSRRTGNIDEAKAAFHELITRYPDSAWTHYLMANAYEDQQQFDKAIDEYKQSLLKDPAMPNARFAIGYLYWRQQDMENAREWLKKEEQQGCHSLAALYLGEIARSEKDLREAEAEYKHALECDPSNATAHLRLGIVLGDEKRYQDAVAQLKAAIRLNPNESSAHYHLASIYSQMGRRADASAEYSRVRQIQAAKDNGVDVTGGSRQ